MARALELRILKEIAEKTTARAELEAAISQQQEELSNTIHELDRLRERLDDARQPVPWPHLSSELDALLREISDFDDELLFTKSDFSAATRTLTDTKFRESLDALMGYGFITKNPSGSSKWGYLKEKMPTEPPPTAANQ